MLIQNRITGVAVVEKIDFGEQLSHFREEFGSYAATWDQRFDDISQTIKITRIDQTTCWIGGNCNDNHHRAYIRLAK